MNFCLFVATKQSLAVARVGIINTFNTAGFPNFTNSSITYTTYDYLFALLVSQYRDYYINNPTSSGESQWNHDLFTVLNYRTKMAQNLVDVHSLLNDTSNDFLNNVNSDPMASGTPYTLDQLMNLVTWIGLEETQEFINNILNNPTQLANKNYVENAARQKYTPNCTN